MDNLYNYPEFNFVLLLLGLHGGVLLLQLPHLLVVQLEAVRHVEHGLGVGVELAGHLFLEVLYEGKMRRQSEVSMLVMLSDSPL